VFRFLVVWVILGFEVFGIVCLCKMTFVDFGFAYCAA